MRRGPASTLVVVIALVAAPRAAASSIVYLKDGDVYRASPGGAQKRVVIPGRSGVSFTAVTQDDRGRLYVVAAPSRRWMRFTARGARSGHSFRTPGTGLRVHYDHGRKRPGFAGPMDVQVSGGGGRLTGWGVTEDLGPTGVRGRIASTVTRADRDQDMTGTAPTSSLAWPSFLPDGSVVAGAFDNVLKSFGIWYFTPGDDTVRFWFGPTDRTLRLASPEVTRAGDYVAVTTDRDSPLSRDDEIVVGHLPGPLPAVPDRDCSWENGNGTMTGLTWSPDGRTLAWSDEVGVWTARFVVPLQTGLTCVVAGKHLLARNATSPDWGPAPS